MQVGSLVKDSSFFGTRLGVVIDLDIDMVCVAWSDGEIHWAWEHLLETLCR